MIVAVVFVLLIAIGMPIGFVLGAAGFTGLIQMGGTSFLHLTPAKIFHGLNIFPFLAMPFFILAGEIMNHTGITATVLHQSPDKRGVPLPVKMVSQLTQTWHSQVRSFC